MIFEPKGLEDLCFMIFDIPGFTDPMIQSR